MNRGRNSRTVGSSLESEKKERKKKNCRSASLGCATVLEILHCCTSVLRARCSTIPFFVRGWKENERRIAGRECDRALASLYAKFFGRTVIRCAAATMESGRVVRSGFAGRTRVEQWAKGQVQPASASERRAPLPLAHGTPRRFVRSRTEAQPGDG